MAYAAGDLNRRIQFLRATPIDDGFASTPGPFQPHGGPVWAAKTDASDSERWRAGQVGTSLSSRFVVRWSPFTAGIGSADKLSCEGVTFAIVGIKEPDGTRRQWLEVTGAAEQP